MSRTHSYINLFFLLSGLVIPVKEGGRSVVSLVGNINIAVGLIDPDSRGRAVYLKFLFIDRERTDAAGCRVVNTVAVFPLEGCIREGCVKDIEFAIVNIGIGTPETKVLAYFLFYGIKEDGGWLDGAVVA